MNLKELFGDDYEKIRSLISKEKLASIDNYWIPKYRFDEVCKKNKAKSNEINNLKELMESKDREIDIISLQIEEIKDGYEKALAVLRVKEVFVDGGITKDKYENLIKQLIKSNEKEMLELAKEIVKLVNKNN